MNISRRKALAFGGAALTVTLVPVSFAQAASEEVMKAAVDAFTGGAAIAEGGIELTTPEIAENGNTVPVAISAPGAKRVILLASGNPNPGVADFAFGALAAGNGSTRIRLAGTQDVVAIAEMADGSFAQVAKAVKVTIGGCGG
ncbi:MAG: thiosulfate oxidation carrier protein SoxY [Rhodobacteraceae bacterium]|nr:thiosulfate oxidation carrier protein SoxY [Paracoccaceae bacterium]